MLWVIIKNSFPQTSQQSLLLIKIYNKTLLSGAFILTVMHRQCSCIAIANGCSFPLTLYDNFVVYLPFFSNESSLVVFVLFLRSILPPTVYDPSPYNRPSSTVWVSHKLVWERLPDTWNKAKIVGTLWTKGKLLLLAVFISSVSHC